MRSRSPIGGDRTARRRRVKAAARPRTPAISWRDRPEQRLEELRAAIERHGLRVREVLQRKPDVEGEHLEWLRSMCGEREELVRRSRPISAIERLVVLSVLACVLAFEGRIFLPAGSPLPNGGP